MTDLFPAKSTRPKPAPWNRKSLLSAAALVAVLSLPFGAKKSHAQPARSIQPAGNQVAATVGSQPIYLSEIGHTIRAVTRGRPVPEESRAAVTAEALEQIIRRRLVQLYLEGEGQTVDPATIDAEVQKQKERFAAQKRDLLKSLQQQGMTEADLRRDLAWQLNWKQYAEKNLTDKHLQDYFKANRAQFDGSQVEASHILLRPTRMDDQKELAATIARVNALRAEIVAEKITFAEAAKKHSDGPSGKDGGQLGFFPRHGMMVESFARTAFALKKGEVSPPVLTRFGVHLIKATGIKPGTKSWTASRPQLTTGATALLFQELSAKQRKTTPVEYTGATPYRDPKTTKLVMPKKP